MYTERNYKSKKELVGMTLKQHAYQEFRIALDAYRIALESGTSAQIVGTSIRVYCAKAGVPKSWHPLVNRMFRETARIK